MPKEESDISPGVVMEGCYMGAEANFGRGASVSALKSYGYMIIVRYT